MHRTHKLAVILVALFMMCGTTIAMAGYSDWDPPVNIDYSNERFSVDSCYDIDSLENIHAAWIDWSGSDRKLRYCTNETGSWVKTTVPMGVPGVTGTSLSITPDGTIYLLFSATPSGQDTMVYYMSKAPGGSWTGPTELTGGMGGNYYWSAVDASGGIYAIWVKIRFNPNRGELYGRYKPYGGSWQSMELIEEGWDGKWPGDGYVSAIGNDFVISYTNGDPYYKFRYSGGTLSARMQLHSGGSFTPKIIGQTDGRLDAVYHRDWTCWYKRSNDWGASWTSPMEILTTDDYLVGDPSICYDDIGNIFLAVKRTEDNGSKTETYFRERIGGIWKSQYDLAPWSIGNSGMGKRTLMSFGNDLHAIYPSDRITNDYYDVGHQKRPFNGNTVAPGAPVSFTATGGENRVTLNWTNPSDTDFAAVQVAMSTTGYPTGPWQSTYVCNEQGSPGTADSYLVYPLSASTTYYFSAFSQDEYGNWSVAAQDSATTFADITPPAPPSVFTATPYTNRNLLLSFRHAYDVDTKGTMIRVKTTGYPTSPTDGTLVVNETGSPGQNETYLHENLTPGQTYYYSAFCYDHESPPNYSSPRTTSGVPVATNIGYIKNLPNGTPVEISDVIVTGIFSYDGTVYVQEQDRSTGICVVHTGFGISVGDKVNVTGTMGYRGSGGFERQIQSASIDVNASGEYAEPLGMGCMAVGGADMPPYIIGVQDANGEPGVGPNNNGLLARIYGKVTDKVTFFLFVDDGTEQAELVGRKGVMVRFPSTSIPANVGDYVSVTGVISGSFAPTTYDKNRRILLVRDNSDLRVYSSVGQITGYVQDAFARPISGADVYTGSHSTTTASDGTYTLTNMTEGTYNVTADKTGYTLKTETGVNVPSGGTVTVNFTLAGSTGKLAGTVEDTSGQPIAGATVTIDSTSYAATTATDGSYSIYDVAPGTYSVTATATGHAPQTVNGVDITADETTWQDFSLTATAGTIEGHVLDNNSNPVPGASVTTDTGGYSATTGTDGYYIIQNVAPDTYGVTASKTNYYSDTAVGVVVTAGNTETVDFNLQPYPGTLTGTVTDSLTGQPVQGATVSTSPGSYSAVTNSNGQYTISSVAADTYTVSASKTNYYTRQVNGIVITPGGTTTCNISMQPEPGTISGFVKDSSNNPISGATVSTNSGGYTTSSATDGSYTLSSVNPGTYSVTASKNSYYPQTISGVVVQSNQNTPVNFNIVYDPRHEVMNNGNFEGGFFDFWGGTIANNYGAVWTSNYDHGDGSWDDQYIGGTRGYGQTVKSKSNGVGVGIAQVIGGLTPGATFEFSADAFLAAGDYKVYIGAAPGDSNGVIIPVTGVQYPTTTGQWHSRTITGTVDSSGAITVYLWSVKQSGTEQPVYFDNCSCISW